MKKLTTTKKHLWHPSRNQQGFTLIEVMVSMVILSVGIFGLIKTASSVIYFQDSSRLTTEATLITTNKIEDIKRLSTEEPTGGTFGFNYLTTTFFDGPPAWAAAGNQAFTLTEPSTGYSSEGFKTTTLLQVYSPGDADFDNPITIKMLELVVKTEWKDSRGIAKEIEMASVLHRRQFLE